MFDNFIPSENSQNILDDKLLQGFGYKISWYVFSEAELKSSHSTIVNLANQLKMQQQKYVSWNQGIDWLAEDYFQPSWYFITPSIQGFNYIVCGVADTLDLLDNLIDNYYAFTSYRG